MSKILDRGIEVIIKDNVAGFIRKTDLSRDRSEQRPDRFAVGEKFDAKVTTMDRATKIYNLSIKAREIDEEKKAMADYGSSDSGASLGEILGEAMRSKQEAGDDDDKPVVKKAAAPKKVEKKAKVSAKPRAKKKTDGATASAKSSKKDTAGSDS